MGTDYKQNIRDMEATFKEAGNRKKQSSAGTSSYQTSNQKSTKTAYATEKKRSKADFDDGYNYTFNSSEEKKAYIRRMQNKKNKRGLKTAIALSIALVFLIGLALFVWYFFFSAGQDTFAGNIKVNGVSISGMTYAKAQRVLSEKEDEIADSINLTATAGNKKINITKKDLNYSFNTTDILDEAMAYSQERGIKHEDREYNIAISVNDASYKTIAANFAKEVDKSAKNSTVTDWDPANLTFEVSESEQGFKIKQEDFAKSLKTYIDSGKLSGTIEADTKVIEPQYSKDYISNSIILVSEFTTTSTNSEAGNTNMELSLAACNGSIIEPEETWSFNTCTGDTNQKSNGYQEAGIIINGKHETGVGGGICQSSTTIYNAQLMAGMVVIERTCHYYKSSYVDAGRDATVDYGNLDLKMMNPYDYQMFLRCYMDGVTLHAEVYSLPNPNWDDITIDSEVIDYFDNGYDASTTRTFWCDGEEIDVETLPNSRYYTSAPGGTTDDVVSYEEAFEDPNSSYDYQNQEQQAWEAPQEDVWVDPNQSAEEQW